MLSMFYFLFDYQPHPASPEGRRNEDLLSVNNLFNNNLVLPPPGELEGASTPPL